MTLWKLCGAQIKAERALGSSRNHGNALPQLCHRTATSPKWHSTPDIFIYPWVKPRFFLGDGSIGRAGTRGTNWWPARSAASTTSNNSNRAPALAYCLSTFSGRAEPNRSTQAGCRAVQLVRGAGLDRFLRGKLSQSI